MNQFSAMCAAGSMQHAAQQQKQHKKAHKTQNKRKAALPHTGKKNKNDADGNELP